MLTKNVNDVYQIENDEWMISKEFFILTKSRQKDDEVLVKRNIYYSSTKSCQYYEVSITTIINWIK